MNLLKAELLGDKLAIGPSLIDLAGNAPASGPVTIGMRAEDLRLARPDEYAMPLAVEYVEELGSQRLVHGMLGDQQLTAVVSPETPLAGEMRFVITPEKLHFFAADSGKRIGAGVAASTGAPVAAEPVQ
jgi:sn-glycerol 3-phosphate transport system ATP-binding protein